MCQISVSQWSRGLCITPVVGCWLLVVGCWLQNALRIPAPRLHSFILWSCSIPLHERPYSVQKPLVKMAVRLCDSCRAFDIQAFDPIKCRVRGYKLLSVITAAKSGCPFCSLLLKARFSRAPKEGVIPTLLCWLQWIYLQPDEEWKHRLDTQFQDDSHTTSSLGTPLGLARLWASSSSPGYRVSHRSIPLSPLQILADEGKPANC
jgi:hypothetical protein